jgi:hypothetical protein
MAARYDFSASWKRDWGLGTTNRQGTKKRDMKLNII